MDKEYEFWFATGSQDLYGLETLEKVRANAQYIVEKLNESLPFKLVWKPTLLNKKEIKDFFNQANIEDKCIGVLAWMHTFSPAKSWIPGLVDFKKPLLHFHSQMDEEIPYDTIDMDYMNENQSAHGGREFGHVVTRLGLERKVIVGHFSDKDFLKELEDWMYSALAVNISRNLRIVRFADNMRNVAVTEGDKVDAAIKFGWEVDTYSINDLTAYVDSVADEDVLRLVDEYFEIYNVGDEASREALRVQARIELGLKTFLEDKDYHAVVTHFDDLGSLKQLPGLAIQRLMEAGYGFGAEGDWKSAGLVRIIKETSKYKRDKKGTSFMEDYVYNFVKGKEGILQAHMLEICPSIADNDISIRVEPLSIGKKENPARLVFSAKEGPGLAISLIDLGHRFRLIVSKVNCKKLEKDMPRLPVASAFWEPLPNLKDGVSAWIYAGGGHHTAFTYDLTSQQIEDFANIMGIECVCIDENLNLRDFRDKLRWNDVYYRR